MEGTNTNLKRIRNEVKKMQKMEKKNPTGISVDWYKEEKTKWLVTFDGPKGTVYEGGKFKLIVDLSHNYPNKFPNMMFDTKIYHVNISPKQGTFCLLKWREAWKAGTKMIAIF